MNSLNQLAPRLRSLLGKSGQPVVVTTDTDLQDPAAVKNLPEESIFVLDITLPGSEDEDEAISKSITLTQTLREKLGEAKPKLVVVPGLGSLAVAESLAETRQILASAQGEEVPASPDCECCCAHGRLSGKVAMVTGAAQGFGLGISQELLNHGASVVLADMNFDLAAKQAAELEEKHGTGRAVPVRIDVSNPDSCQEAVAEVVKIYGGIDLFVSNAGVLRAEGVMTQPVADFDLVTNVNYRGYFFTVRAVAPVMAAQRQGDPDTWLNIVEVNSKSGLEGSKRNFAYAGSKFGGIGLTQSFALELVEYGIKINAVCPGNFLDGPLWMDPERGLFVQYLRAGKVPGAKTIDDVREFYEAKVPMRRGCLPVDVARAILYTVEQDYETGQAIPVTGGQNMLN